MGRTKGTISKGTTEAKIEIRREREKRLGERQK